MITRVASVLSALLIGYATAHIVVHYMLGHVLLGTVGVKLSLSSALSARQVLNLMVLGGGIAGLVLDRDEIASSTWRMTLLIGMALFFANLITNLIF